MSQAFVVITRIICSQPATLFLLSEQAQGYKCVPAMVQVFPHSLYSLPAAVVIYITKSLGNSVVDYSMPLCPFRDNIAAIVGCVCLRHQTLRSQSVPCVSAEGGFDFSVGQLGLA